MYKQSGIKAKETLVMLDFTYHMPVRILTGRKIVSKEGDLLRVFGKKAAVITGKSSAAKSGALADIADICTRTSVTFQVYNSVQNDPPVANVLEIAAEIKQFQPDFLIAIGGGSVIDAAKVVSYLLTNGISPETIWQKPRLSPLPLVAIPTTAGTGSEVTPYAVLTVPEDETKKSVVTPLIYPKVAFLDPAYTESMPREVTINTAIDALSHLIEGFIAKRANNLSDILAIEGMELMAKALPSLPKGEFASSCREHLLYASLFGGLTIAKTGTTLVHALGYSLTYYHGIEHGRANGYSQWKEAGFDAVMLQPNYMFHLDKDNSRLLRAAIEAKTYSMGLEFEASPDVLIITEQRERYYDYLRTAVTLGYGNDILRGWYQDVKIFHDAARSTWPEVREVYDVTYKFVKGEYTETIQFE
jgi:alcohol dehydrogenase class IV